VADVGTGSGCIAIAIAHYAPNVELWAGDVSADALEVAIRNVSRHAVVSRVHLACGDLMDPLPGAFDLVCANLPYVPVGKTLAPEVVAQPAGAVFADRDGAGLVTRLLVEVPARLNPGGRVLVELDPSILAAVLDEADRGFAGYSVHRDLGGHERVLEAWC
jgi:release factor glutamine methyltransferase